MKFKQILKSFSDQEIQEFLALLQLRFLGNTLAMYHFMQACVELNTKDQNWNEKDLSRLLYPQKNAEKNVQYIRIRLVDLKNYTYKYIAIKAFQVDSSSNERFLLQGLNNRNLKKMFLEEYKKIYNAQMSYRYYSYSRNENMLELKEQFFQFGEFNEYKNPDSQFQNSLNLTDRAYILRKLKLICKANNQDWAKKSKHIISFEKELEEMILSTQFKEDLLIQLYYSLSKITSHASPKLDAYFYTGKKIYFRLLPFLKEEMLEDAKEMFIYLTNYCVMSYNNKQEKFGHDLSYLYLNILREGIIDEKGEIDAYYFKNICSLLVFVNKFDTLNDLFQKIEKEESFSLKIKGESPKGMLFFCKGHAAFHKKDFQGASEYLFRARMYLNSSRDFQLEAEARALEIRTSYLLKDFMQASLELKGLNKFLEKIQIQDNSKFISFQNFCKFFSSLNSATRAKYPRKEKLLFQLYQKIKDEEVSFYAKTWIKEILEYLLNDKSLSENF